jgi:two-component system sensor histidine kinase DesK
MNRRIAAFFLPAPDSLAAATLRRGKSPWVDAVHLLWSFWLFVTPLWSSDGWNARWLAFTLASYPVFLLLYYKSVVAPRDAARGYALGLVLLSMALVPWYPSVLT